MKLIKIIKLAVVLACMALTACGGEWSSDKSSVNGGISGTGRGGFKIFGDAQKGPFVQGAVVRAQYVDPVTRKPLGRSFFTNVNASHGSYQMDLPKVGLVELSVSGQYSNEFTGVETSHTLELKSLIYVKNEVQKENINVLTHLVNHRIGYLIDERFGALEDDYVEAKAQAEDELKASLESVVFVQGNHPFGELNLYDKDSDDNRKGNAYLLAATSVLYQYMLNKIPDDVINPGALIDGVLAAATEDFRPDGDFDIEDFLESLDEAVKKLNAELVLDNLFGFGGGALVADMNAILDSDLDGAVNNHDADDDDDGVPDVVDDEPYNNENNGASNLGLLSFYEDLSLSEGFDDFNLPNVQPYISGHSIEFSVFVSDSSVIDVVVNSESGDIILSSIAEVCGNVDVTITASIEGYSLSRTFSVNVVCADCSYRSLEITKSSFDSAGLIGKSIDVNNDLINDYVYSDKVISGADGSVLFLPPSGEVAAYVGDVNDDDLGDFLVSATEATEEGYRQTIYSGGDSGIVHEFNVVTPNESAPVMHALDIEQDGIAELYFDDRGFTTILNVDGTERFTMTNIVLNIQLDSVLMLAGDVNGDGFLDFAQFSGPPVIFGLGAEMNHIKSGKTGEILETYYADSYNFEIDYITSVGDLDADGYDDLVLGVSLRHVEGVVGRDQIRVVSSKNRELLYTLEGADHVEAIEDVNGDGVNDLFVSYLKSASNSRINDVIFKIVSGVNGTVLSVIDDEQLPNSDIAYSSVAAENMGDVNQDGFIEMRVTYNYDEVYTYSVGEKCRYETTIILEKNFSGYAMRFYDGVVSRIELSVNGIVDAVINSMEYMSIHSLLDAVGDVMLTVYDDTVVGVGHEKEFTLMVTSVPEISPIPDYQLSQNFGIYSIPLIIKTDRADIPVVEISSSNEEVLTATYDVSSNEIKLLSGIDACGVSSVVVVDVSYRGVSSSIEFDVSVNCDVACTTKGTHLKPVWSHQGERDGMAYAVKHGVKLLGDVNDDGFDDYAVLVSGHITSAYVSVISGKNGVEINRINSNNNQRYPEDYISVNSLLIAADVNADGIKDVGLIYDVSANTGLKDHVVFYSAADGSEVLYLPAEALDFGFLGSSIYSLPEVVSLGDVNGDLFADLLITINGDEYATGKKLRVISGVDGSEVYEINLPEGIASSRLGATVAGDINGDDVSDIIVAMPEYSSTDAEEFEGAVFIYSGIDAVLLSTIYGPVENDYLGLAFGAAGDVNNDGFDDVIVGGDSYVAIYSGVNDHVIWAFNYQISIDSIENEGDYYQVGAAGDIDGDGFDDVYISTHEGMNYIHSGKSGAILYALNSNTVNDNIALSELSYGSQTLLALGDVNNDGFADLLIGGVKDYVNYEEATLHAFISESNVCPYQKIVEQAVNDEEVTINVLEDWRLLGSTLEIDFVESSLSPEVNILNGFDLNVFIAVDGLGWFGPNPGYSDISLSTDNEADGDLRYVIVHTDYFQPEFPEFPLDVHLSLDDSGRTLFLGEHAGRYTSLEVMSADPGLLVSTDIGYLALSMLRNTEVELHTAVTVNATVNGEEVTSTFNVHIE